MTELSSSLTRKDVTTSEREADRERYARVNGAWPSSLPALTGPEAVSAFKRLWRKATGKPLPKQWRIKLTSGNRRNDLYGNPKVINPEAGWNPLVHHISHRAHHYVNGSRPDFDPHGTQHAGIERTLIEYVVASGWLDGKLKRKEKPAPTLDDVRAKRRANVAAKLARWQSKEKRAATAIKKLKRTLAYYDRAMQ